MNIEVLVVGCIQTNCLIIAGKNNSAIVVDPGGDAPAIRRFLAKHNLSVASYVLTHGHVDHISAVADLYRSNPAPISMHQADLDWAFEADNNFLPYLQAPARPPKIERILKDGQEWTDAGLKYRIISTPGHTPGSVCLHFAEDEVLVTGDTLFCGSVGRTDLPGGDSKTLQKSLKILAGFPDVTTIYPGHGPSSTIQEEKRSNFFLARL